LSVLSPVPDEIALAASRAASANLTASSAFRAFQNVATLSNVSATFVASLDAAALSAALRIAPSKGGMDFIHVCIRHRPVQLT
jgi:hypothetical protein